MESQLGDGNRQAVVNLLRCEPSSPLASRYIISPDAIDCPLGEGIAVLNSTAGVYFSLNPTGALIWDVARQPASVAEMCARLTGAFPHANADFEADVRQIVSELVAAGLFDALPDTAAEHDPA